MNTADPDCDNKSRSVGCSNCMGCNHKLLGGCAGIATGLGFAVEYTKDAGAHAHGLRALANMYSRNTLSEISD
eukprot:9718248-Karenia_brevis.AAC.1